MQEIDFEEMGPTGQALMIGCLGMGATGAGLVGLLIFWPLGVLFLGIGALIFLLTPVLWVLFFIAARQETDDGDVEPAA